MDSGTGSTPAESSAETSQQERNTGTGASLRLLVLLDITGSMGSELEACKHAVRQLVTMCSQELPEFAGQLAFAFVTFTESKRSGCNTSLMETTCLEEAQEYVDKIKLCVPPEQPWIDANGDDGPENQKAALARTTDLDPSVPTIAFLITDAAPHLKKDDLSSTAQHELRYLTAERGLSLEDASDLFRTFRKTALDHFAGNLILNCVIYGCGGGRHGTEPSDEQLLYGALAQQTGAMLMQPDSRDAAQLASGLITVVKALLGHLLGGQVQQQLQGGSGGIEQLQGFRLFDLSGVNEQRESEEDEAGTVEYGDSEAIFNIAMERMVAVCGKKWSKRALGMTAPAEQLQFVWRAARYISLCSKVAPTDPTEAAQLAEAKATELERLLKLRTDILAQLPEAQAGHFSIREQDLQQLAEEAAAWGSAGGGVASVSAISMESVGEALEDDAVWEDWLHTVMNLLLGFPVQVQLPLDAAGQPDFMDAWSAVMERMGVDRISASEFMQLVVDNPTARGLTDKREYNAFLVVVEPTDKLASLVFRIASGTQALDYISGVLMGAKGFLPHLHAGLTAACLVRLLGRSTALTEFEWFQVQQMAHTLRTRALNAAKGVGAKLLQGQANPADSISKFVLAALRICNTKLPSAPASSAAVADQTGVSTALSTEQQQVLRLVLHEWLASMVQRYYGKRTSETDEQYLQSLLEYVPVELVLRTSTDPFDPLQQLSPLEAVALTGYDPATSALPQGVQPDWKEQILKRLLGGHAGLNAHPVLAQFLLNAGRLLALLQPPGSATAAAAETAIKSSTKGEKGERATVPDLTQGPAAALDTYWPGWKQAALQALLLRMRTARYQSKLLPAGATTSTKDDAAAPAPAAKATAAAPATMVVWEPVPVSSCLVLVVERLQEAMATELKSYRQARTDEARQKLIAATCTLLQQHANDAEAACIALKQLQLSPESSSSCVKQQASSTAAGTEAAAAATTTSPSATLLGQTVLLQRKDVPAVLEQLGASLNIPGAVASDLAPASPAAEAGVANAASTVLTPGSVTPSILHVLVVGDWCSQGAQALRNSKMVHQLCHNFGSSCDSLMDAIMAVEVCTRTKGFNRHGHSSQLPYPGPSHWSPEYSAARLAAVAGRSNYHKVEKYLKQMQRFTAMAEEAAKEAAGNAVQQAAVECLLATQRDAYWYEHVLGELRGILDDNGL